MKGYGTLVSKLLISLIINLFKEICIPVTSNDNRIEETLIFLRTLEYKGFYLDYDMFYTITNFIENINRSVVNNKNYKNHEYYNRTCKKYLNFVAWINKNKDYFNSDSVIISNELCTIEVNEKNEKFMLELLEHYEKTSFAFPYLKFNFGLSAGEFNFLNLFANIYSILENSEKGEVSVIKNTYIGGIKCTDLLLIFDEADLSLHPRWQQQYLYWLLKFIESVFPMCRVHILIATHSPIMLSDFPQDNVIYLNHKEEISMKREVKTFGSNIHDLFLDSFFLSDSGTIGEFAEKKINQIVEQLNEDELLENEMEDISKIINFVGDDLIRNQLLKIYNNAKIK